jgi:hypothetical protein
VPIRHGVDAAHAMRPSLLVSRAGLRRAGFDPDLATRESAAGRWQWLATDTYLPHANPPTEAELVAAAGHHVGRPFVVTGSTVLHALNLRWVPATSGLHVLVPADCQVRSTGQLRLTRTRDLDAIATWVRHGARYADADRAVVDTTRSLTRLRDVRGVLLGAVHDGWATPADLRVILDGGQRNGSALTRRAIADAERGCASPPEAELVDALVGCRLPFYVNPELWLDGRFLGSPDVWLMGLGLGGEVESKERHEGAEQVESTYDRHERITAPGLELVHLSVRRIHADVNEAAAHLLRRATDRALLPGGLREPAGWRVVPRGPLLT